MAENNKDEKQIKGNEERGRRGRDEKPRDKKQASTDGFDQIAVETRRVTKVTKGAKRFKFSAIVVVGNKDGKVGVALAKGMDPKQAIDKASKTAKTKVISVVLNGTTIPHVIQTNYGSSKIILKPASKGTGIIAGSSVRAVVELAGIKDIRAKIIGGNNKVNNVYCTFKALSLLRDKRI